MTQVAGAAPHSCWFALSDNAVGRNAIDAIIGANGGGSLPCFVPSRAASPVEERG